jgi:CRP-like cAMP-binding protein
MSSTIAENLSKMHLFRQVPNADLENLVTACEVLNYGMTEVICNQGDQASNALILVSGRLEVSVRTENSVRHVGEIFPGEIFGETGLFHSKGTRSATVMANRPSTCLVLTPRLMRDVADNQAMVALERHLIATMARRIRATNLAIQKAWKESVEEIIEEPSEQETEEEKPSLLGRLRSLFGN